MRLLAEAVVWHGARVLGLHPSQFCLSTLYRGFSLANEISPWLDVRSLLFAKKKAFVQQASGFHSMEDDDMGWWF